MPLALSTSTVYEMCMTAWDTQACHTPAFTATAAYAPANPETLDDSEAFLLAAESAINGHGSHGSEERTGTRYSIRLGKHLCMPRYYVGCMCVCVCMYHRYICRLSCVHVTVCPCLQCMRI